MPPHIPDCLPCSPEPMEKVMANLAGARMIMGRKMKKAMARNSTPAGRRQQG